MNEPRIDDAGIGAAAQMGIRVYEQAGRGSGRTHRMIMALKENSMVLCYGKESAMIRTIRDLRGPEFQVTVRSCRTWDEMQEGVAYARARHQPVAMDHYLIFELYRAEITNITQRLAREGVVEHPYNEAHGFPPPVSMFDSRKWPGEGSWHD